MIAISIISVICENCSKNATCEEGECVCEPGYSGDGMTCNCKFLLEDKMSN